MGLCPSDVDNTAFMVIAIAGRRSSVVARSLVCLCNKEHLIGRVGLKHGGEVRLKHGGGVRLKHGGGVN